MDVTGKREEPIVSFKIWNREEAATEVHILERHVVEGAEEGPHVVIVAGSHGDELLAIDAAKRMYRELDPADVSGTVSIIAGANMFAVKKGTRETPVPEFELYEDEQRNLNRCFDDIDLDGGPSGSITQRLAYHILDLVVDADYCFDLHTATRPGYKIDQIREKTDPEFSPEVRKEQERLVRGSGVGYVVRTVTDKIGRGVLAGVAPRYGVPAVTVEIGGGVYTPGEMEEYVEVIRNLLATVDVLEGEGGNTDQKLYRDLAKISAPTAGEYTKHVAPGDTVEAGDVLGTIANDAGTHEVVSPHDGLVESVHRKDWVNEGTKLGHLAIREEVGPLTDLLRGLSRTLDSLLARARISS